MFAGWKAQLSQLTGEAPGRLADAVVAFHGYLSAEYGPLTAWAVYLAIASLLALLLWRLVKFSFDVVRCVAIPSMAVALIGAWLSPLSFMHILPVAALVFTGVMVFRG
ncbi:MAG: hypothetical protein WBP29_04485 [Candidatus Zixiibacteriota bacterium]